MSMADIEGLFGKYVIVKDNMHFSCILWNMSENNLKNHNTMMKAPHAIFIFRI